MPESTTSKANTPVKIENPEQASSNFYWLYHTNTGPFNIQTTVRGILTLEQMKAHVKSILELSAHIVEIGGIAKQVGRTGEVKSEATPEALPVEETPEEELPTEPTYVPVEEPQEKKAEEFSFVTQFIKCTITDGKSYFKILGVPFMEYGVTVWPEVLTSVSINYNKMEGGKKYKLEGYKATYIKNAKGSPQKVIRLEKVA